MKTNYLLPNRFKRIGWILFIPGILLGILYLINYSWEPDFFTVTVFSIAEQPILGETSFFSFTKNNILDEIIGLLIIIGALFVAFSKERSEDEFISRVRLESLVWATYVNYAVLIVTILFTYDLVFFWVLVFNMFTILIFFILRFNWFLYISKKQLSHEE